MMNKFANAIKGIIKNDRKSPRKEMFEDQYENDIKMMIKNMPETVMKVHNNGENYYRIGIAEHGGSYTAYENKLLFNGKDVSDKITKDFPAKMYPLLQTCYLNKFKQKAKSLPNTR